MIDRVPARRLADMSHYDLEKINWAVAVLTRLAFGQIPVAHSQLRPCRYQRPSGANRPGDNTPPDHA